jgi:hypothetical protein
MKTRSGFACAATEPAAANEMAKLAQESTEILRMVFDGSSVGVEEAQR